MSCDLERIYGDLAARLPDDPGAEAFYLDESVLPAAPSVLASDRIHIRRGFIQRLPGCRGDYLDVIAPRSTIRQLGLLFLAVLFHEKCDRSTIRLMSPDSTVKYVVTASSHSPKRGVTGFRWRPWVLGYVPDDVGHTFMTVEKSYAPIIRLTNLDNCQHNESDWQNRDVLEWGGGGDALADSAEFLLNAGRQSAKLGHFTFPANEIFFAAEVHLWTPEQWNHLQQSLSDFQKQYSQISAASSSNPPDAAS